MSTKEQRAAMMEAPEVLQNPPVPQKVSWHLKFLHLGDTRRLSPLWILMDTKRSYLSGVELNDAVAGWRANLMEDIRSSGGLQSSAQEGMFPSGSAQVTHSQSSLTT